MRTRKILPAALFTALALLAAAVPALSSRKAGPLSRAKSCVIDGRRYVLEPCAESDLDRVRREVQRLGVDAPLPGASSPPSPAFREAVVKESAGGNVPPFPLPQGFRTERVLRTVSDSGAVDLAFGSFGRKGSSPIEHLRAARWECLPVMKAGGGVSAAATLTKGKETYLVLLEEKEGRFLVFRRLEK